MFFDSFKYHSIKALKPRPNQTEQSCCYTTTHSNVILQKQANKGPLRIRDTMLHKKVSSGSYLLA